MFFLDSLFQIPYSFRVTHAADIVPHIPPQNFHGFNHHGVEVIFLFICYRNLFILFYPIQLGKTM